MTEKIRLHMKSDGVINVNDGTYEHIWERARTLLWLQRWNDAKVQKVETIRKLRIKVNAQMIKKRASSQLYFGPDLFFSFFALIIARISFIVVSFVFRPLLKLHASMLCMCAFGRFFFQKFFSLDFGIALFMTFYIVCLQRITLSAHNSCAFSHFWFFFAWIFNEKHMRCLSSVPVVFDYSSNCLRYQITQSII